MRTTKFVILMAFVSVTCSAFTNLAIHRRFNATCTDASVWCLGLMSHVTQTTPNVTGGPQALEGYALVNHPNGRVRQVLATIGNIELKGAGATADARALQGSVVVNGPGRVDFATSLNLVGCVRQGGYDGPIDVGRCDYVTFGNGWSLRPDGDALLLCDPRGVCRPL